MKKFISIFFIIIAIFLFASCQSNSNPASTSGSNPPESIVPSTPTPKPTLSEEDKIALSEYNTLISYCRNYNDWYAALLLKQMLDDGRITTKQFSAIYDIESFQKAKDFDNNTWADIKVQLDDIKDIFNGQSKGLDKSGMDNFYNYICSASQQGTVFISIFNTPEIAGRIANAINDINIWFDTPNEENFQPVEKSLLSENSTPAEILILSCYILNSPRIPSIISTQDGDMELSAFLEKHTISTYSNQAYEDLFKMNQ